MSIDARISSVEIKPDGSGKLVLIDRPSTIPGDNPGIAGQSSLTFDRAPGDVTAIVGCDIWGNESQIMIGEQTIARRIGYGGIEFVGGFSGVDAAAKYWCGQKSRKGS
jgi:hypothetical protein